MKPVGLGSFPLPPDQLALYVGGQPGGKFLEQGRRLLQCLRRCLPPSFGFKNKRILDFGCGVGRVLRHFEENTKETEFWGCDISESCIAWLRQNLCPPFHFVQNGENPPLPFEDEHFDLVYSLSVFTHLTDSWEPWLREIRRVMKPDGLALLTFLNRTAHEFYEGSSFDKGEVAFKVTHPERSWSLGGPIVYHSNAWILNQWSRILPVQAVFREGMAGFQSVALMRKGDHKLVSTAPHIYQPFPYCRLRSDFRGDLHLDPFQQPTWFGKPGIPVAPQEPLPGWFASKRGRITHVKAELNGAEAPCAGPISLPRPDVYVAYPKWPNSRDSGFMISLDFHPGLHDLRLTATDVRNDRLSISAVIRVV